MKAMKSVLSYLNGGALSLSLSLSLSLALYLFVSGCRSLPPPPPHTHTLSLCCSRSVYLHGSLSFSVSLSLNLSVCVYHSVSACLSAPTPLSGSRSLWLSPPPLSLFEPLFLFVSVCLSLYARICSNTFTETENRGTCKKYHRFVRVKMRNENNQTDILL